MNRVAVKRVGLAVLGGMVAVWVLAVALASEGESLLDRFHSLGDAIWVLPIVAGASVGVAAWLAFSALPGDEGDPVRAQHACPACGKPIRDDWRLCPHCGTLVGGEDHARDGVPT